MYWIITIVQLTIFFLNIPIPCYIFVKQLSLFVLRGGRGGYLRIIPCFTWLAVGYITVTFSLFYAYMWRHTQRCHGRLHYNRKFQIFIHFVFIIGYINVDKGVFYLIISYLRIKSYNVLNYTNIEPFWLCFNIRSTAIQC
jgi:hypothetical protein